MEALDNIKYDTKWGKDEFFLKKEIHAYGLF